MRIPARSLTALFLAIGLATCSDTPIAGVKQGLGPNTSATFGRIGFAPVFNKTATYVAEHAADFGITYDSLRLVLRGFPDTTVIVKDTVIHFTQASADTSIDLLVPVQTDGQRFDAALQYRGPSGIVYSGHAEVQSYPPGGTPPAGGQQITISYVGPGARVAHISVSPKTVTLLSSQTTSFSVTAVDSNNAAITVPFISWTTSDAGLASISSTGGLTPAGRRGTVTITASTPTGISDNAAATITLPAASISLVSGGGQTGVVGSALPTAATVQVNASDGVGVAGVSVIFSAPAGGSVGTTSAVTDASGRASTTLHLGNAAGPQAFAATAGAFSIGISETATAGAAAAIAAVSGGGQTDTVGHALKSAFVVKVSDQFNNPVSGTTVSWSRTGAGALSAATSTTGSDGTASIRYTLGGTPGSETISASVSGVSSPVSFTATAVSGGPANVAALSGSGQSGRAGEALASPFIVRVTDASGNPVAGTAVAWTAVNGTIATSTTTDATGQTSATLTLGTKTGAASASATAGGKTASFTATVSPGVPAALVWRTQPANGATHVALTPAPQIAITDAFGNLTASAAAVQLTLAGGTSGAVLSGGGATASGGVATFSNLSIDRTGTGYTLVASTPLFTSTSTSTAFNVAQSPAAQLLIVGSPTITYVAGSPPTTLPSIKTADSLGNGVGNVPIHIVSSVNGTVITAVDATTGTDGTISPPASVLPNKAATYSVHVTSSAIPGAAVDLTVVVTAGAAAKLTISVQPPVNATNGVALLPQPVVQLADQFGNPVPAGSAMTIVATSSAGTVSNGTATANATSGAATFSNLSIATSAPNVTLTFSVQGSSTIQSVTSTAIALSAGVASQLVLSTTQTSFTKVAGTSVSNPPTITTVDAGGNPVGNTPVRFTVAFQSTPTVFSADVTLTSNASGVINGSSVTIPDSATTYVVTASLVSAPTVTKVVSVTVTPGVADHLAFTSGSSSTFVGTQSATGQSPATNFSVTVQDAFNNLVADGTSVFWNIGYCATGISLNATTTTTTHGVAISPTIDVTPSTTGSCQIEAGLTAGFIGNGVRQRPLTNRARPANNGAPRRPNTSTASRNITVPGRASMMMNPVTEVEAFAIIAPSGSNVWLGQHSDDYNSALNWNSGSIPTTSTNVFIPAAVQSPSIGAAGGVANSIKLEDGNSNQVQLNGHILAIYDSVDAGGSGITNGTLQLLANHATAIKGTLPTTFVGNSDGNCGDANYSVSGTTSSGQLTVNCTLVIGQYTVSTTGDVHVGTATVGISTTPGVLDMTDSRGVLNVGNATHRASITFAGYDETNLLTFGTINVTGDFTSQTANDCTCTFVASGSHKVKFTGSTAQTVTLGFGQAQFNDVEVANTNGGVSFAHQTEIYRNLTITGSTVTATGANRLIVGGAVTANATANLSGVDSLRVTGATFPIYNNTSAQTGPRLTELTGSPTLTANRTVAGGLRIGTTLDINGFTLTVLDSLDVAGLLDMPSTSISGPKNVVVVGGNAMFEGSSSTAHISAGELDVGGNFTQSSTSPTSFDPSSGFLVKLNGTGAQSVMFNHPGSADSHFDKLEITNTSANGVTFDSDVQVNGALDLDASGMLTIGTSRTLTIGNSGSMRLHKDSKLVVNGNIGPSSLSCQRHDQAGLHPASVTGTNTSLLNGTALLALTIASGVCVDTNLP
ncbi:MAG TPA: Ig-like domain-containing protein [Gemmatimonadaceae bacterium]|nr:Ig-like domain-containing protein [Gemmatimonadaceae bacterium]